MVETLAKHNEGRSNVSRGGIGYCNSGLCNESQKDFFPVRVVQGGSVELDKYDEY